MKRREDWLKFTFKAWPLVFLLTAGLCYATTEVSRWMGHPLSEQASLDAIRNMRGWRLAGWIALIAVVAPVAEEVIFRLGLFAFPVWVVRKCCRRETVLRILTALLSLSSSFLFMAAHYRGFQALDNAFFALFVFGLVQICLLRRSGTILSPMLNHALFNMTNLAGLFLLPPPAVPV